MQATRPRVGVILILLSAICMVAAHRHVHAQPHRLKFDRLTAEDGLSQNSVCCVLQDHRGFLWIGTEDGLNRYDGHTFTTFTHDPRDTTSLSHSWIWSLYEDRQGTIWVGTYGAGLNRFDRNTETFTRFGHDPEERGGISGTIVEEIYEDGSGTLWIGTDDGGLDRFDRGTETFSHFANDVLPRGVHAIREDAEGWLWIGTKGGLSRVDPHHPGHVIHYHDESVRWQHVTSLLLDDAGVLWVGTFSRGLSRLEVATGRLTHFEHDPSDVSSLSDDGISALFEDGNKQLWVGTRGGLHRFDPATASFTRFVHDPDDPYSISNDAITSIHEDRSGVLWIGTRGGLSKFKQETAAFRYYLHEKDNPQSLSSNFIFSLLEDREGTIWVGTVRGGLCRLDRDSRGTFKCYRHDPNDPASLSQNVILSLLEDRTGELWVGTSSGGLNRLDRRSNARGAEAFTRYSSGPAPDQLSNSGIMTLYEDRRGTLWIGTWNGLNRLDPDRPGQFTRYVHEPEDPNSLGNNTVYALHEDSRGALWVGTIAGLDRLDRATDTFTHFTHDPADTSSLSGTLVAALHEDRRGRLWVGTSGGLSLLDSETRNRFSHFTTRDGLPNNMVYCILEDDHGLLWLSTNRGLSRFDPETRSFDNYGLQDGLRDSEFNLNSCLKTLGGEMLFGGRNGLVRFHPDSLRKNRFPPQVVITDLHVFGRPVRPGRTEHGVQLENAMSEMQALRLSYRTSVFSFGFMGLHFADPARNRYAYRMEGFDRDWIEVGTQRSASYANLPAGSYNFRVRAANSNGVWNEEGASLRVTITPPPWKTGWAYGFYVLLVIGAVYGIVRGRSLQLERRNRELGRLVEARTEEVKLQKTQIEAQAKALVELDAMKSRFFANISHEFRTPLTLTFGPLDDLIVGRYRTVEEARPHLERARRNGQRLLRLINQLLDLARLDAGTLALDLHHHDLADFLRQRTAAFESLAQDRGLSLHFVPDYEPLPHVFDAEKLETVVLNLLSNAFKFTPSGGSIILTVRKDREEQAVITVRDTGPGIPSAHLSHLFDRFYQVDGSATRSREGTGIGLALVRQLVELHAGRIEVESTVGVGTTFTITLPLLDGLSGGMRSADPNAAEAVLAELAPRPEESNGKSIGEEEKIVLVVEDNGDMRAYLRAHLEDVYHVEEAADGLIGLERARELVPDMVVSDVMMPGLDGLGLLTALKSDALTSHVPVLLLTARADLESRIAGLESGADAYLAKPFHGAELKARVENLIEQRRRLQAVYSRKILAINPDEMELPPLETAFLDRVRAAVERHLGDTSFGVDRLADEVGMSRRQLHRKLDGLIGEAPGVLIRRVRMERAAALLQSGARSVKEVAFDVGFRSSSSFREAFRETFGVSPSKYEA